MKMWIIAAGAACLAVPALAGDNVRLTHNVDDTTIQYGTIAGISDTPPLTTHDNTWWRFFERDQFALRSEVRFTRVRFGVEQARSPAGWQPVTVTLFAMEVGPFGNLKMTQIDQVTDFIADQERGLVTISVDATLEEHQDLAVAIAPFDFGAPGYDGSFFFIGTNRLGETGVSMLSCPSAGDPEPTPYHAIAEGASDMAIVMTVFGETSCPGDCDGSGELDFFDFICFMSAFSAQDPSADCDDNGVLDMFDVMCFQQLLAGTCGGS